VICSLLPPVDNTWVAMTLVKIREKIVRTVLCCIVYHICAGTWREQFYRWLLVLVYLNSLYAFCHINQGHFVCITTRFLCSVCLFLVGMSLVVKQMHSVVLKNHLWNYLLHAKKGVKFFCLLTRVTCECVFLTQTIVLRVVWLNFLPFHLVIVWLSIK